MPEHSLAARQAARRHSGDWPGFSLCTAEGSECWHQCYGCKQALLGRSSMVPVWWQSCLDCGQEQGSCSLREWEGAVRHGVCIGMLGLEGS